jgi:hypothetical protein
MHEAESCAAGLWEENLVRSFLSTTGHQTLGRNEEQGFMRVFSRDLLSWLWINRSVDHRIK